MFDMVCCINLRRRDDRWNNFRARIPADWPFREIMRFPAIDGQACPHPDWWREGSGAWGCFRSHVRVLEEALNCGLKSVLVFEDDAVFPPGFAADAKQFLEHLPDDWQLIHFGGQLLKIHFRRPALVNEWVYRPFNVNRMHAYAVRGNMLRVLYEHYMRRDWYENYHVDHHLGRLHESGQHAVYVPRRWLVGQLGEMSDICGKQTSTSFWLHPEDVADKPLSTLAIVLGLFESGASQVAMMLHKLGVFMGDPLVGYGSHGGGEDKKLAELCERRAPFPAAQTAISRAELFARVGDWLGTFLWRAESKGMLAGAKHPDLCALGPYLKEMCGENLKVIHVDRSLEESIHALQAQHLTADRKTPISPAAADQLQRWLWNEKQQFLAQTPHLTVQYDELRTDPISQVRRMVDFLELSPTDEQFLSACNHPF